MNKNEDQLIQVHLSEIRKLNKELELNKKKLKDLKRKYRLVKEVMQALRITISNQLS
jgi:hypothetical protein